MNVSSVSGNGGNWGSCQMGGVNGGNNNKQGFADFKALSAALNSGDTTAATQAFTTMQQDLQNAPQNPSGTSPIDPNSQIGKDFQAIGDALKSGDVSAAKQAFATFKQDVRAIRHAHHHHHQDNAGDDSSTTSSVTPASTASASAITNGLNLTA